MRLRIKNAHIAQQLGADSLPVKMFDALGTAHPPLHVSNFT